jgi:hypothetical protein
MTMTKEYFIKNVHVQLLHNMIADQEEEIKTVVEELKTRRERKRELKRRLHAIENPGKPFIDTDLF